MMATGHRGARRALALAAMALLAACAAPAGDAVPGPAAAAEAGPAGPCLGDQWAPFLAPRTQTFAAEPPVPVDGGLIAPVVYGPLAPPFGKLYVFTLVRGACALGALSVGSYEPTTASARAGGIIGPAERLYHTDLYLPGRHVLLAHATVPPSYLDALALARRHLEPEPRE